jgi:type IV pilus assembly protein PilB
MKALTPKGIEDILFKQAIITQEQLSKIKLEALNSDKSVESIVLENGWATEEQLVQTQAELIGVPYIDLSNTNIASEILNYIPEPIARRYQLIPLKLENDTLNIAMVDPLDSQVIQFIEQKTGFKVQPYISTQNTIVRVINDQYAHNISSDVNAALNEAGNILPQNQTNEAEERAKADQVIREAPVAKIVATILEYGIKARASDIHVEPLEDKTRIRYRIDGILQEKLVLPRKVHDAVVSRVKILSDMKIDERRIPQDGRFNFKVAAEEVDLRVSTLPTVHGEKIVMRLLKKSGGVPTMQELGIRGQTLRNLETQALRPHGIILVTGPTGSGKTTTLYALLTKLNSPKVNIVTLEDPVEYQMSGINQVQVNPQAGLTFASGLRSFLRQDPNIIMVGEIRDTETANLAIQAALTGHLVFSTIHTNSAAGALPRLLDMGGEPFLIASSVNGIEAQRVVRKICTACKTEFTPAPEIIDDLKTVLESLYDAAIERGASQVIESEPELTSAPRTRSESTKEVKLYKGNGCNECGGTGYKGRIGIYEVLVVTEKIGKLILEHQPASSIENLAKADGMITMKQDGYLKALEGLTTLEEVLRVAQE